MNGEPQCVWCGRAGHDSEDCKVPRDIPLQRVKPRIYIAGKMTGEPDFNYPAFNAAASRLRALGFDVENPAECELPIGSPWQEFMRSGITQLMRCDQIVLLPGWEKSRGATLEYMLAMQLGMTCTSLGEVLAEHGELA